MGLFTFLASFAVSLILSTVFKPKAKQRNPENTVQREGVDEPLERLYGKRRMYMVVTDIYTSRTQNNPGFINFGAVDPFALKSVWKHRGTAEVYTADRVGYLYVQGPLCIQNRLNAPLSNPDVASLNVLVDGNNTPADIAAGKVGNVHVVYTKGGVGDPYARSVLLGQKSDLWSHSIHACTGAFLHLEKKLTYAGIPEWSFELDSNPLFDPRDVGNISTDASTWTGRNSNPVLQLLDYLIDEDFGPAIAITDIDLPSFEFCAKIADIFIAYESTSQRIKEGYDSKFELVFEHITETKLTKAALFRSNITLNTADKVSTNVENILASMRGARLFKNRLGKWKLAFAWLLSDDLIQTETGLSGTGPFRTNFAYDLVDLTVKKNGVVITPVQIVNEISNGEQNSTVLPTFDTAVYTFATSTFEVTWPTGTAPTPIDGKRYVFYKSNSRSQVNVTFIASPADPVKVGDVWTYTGTYQKQPSQDQSFGGSGYNGYYEDNVNEVQQGIVLAGGDALSPGDTLTIEYNSDKVPGLEVAAHIIHNPEDIGLDYDATVDGNGLPLIKFIENSNVTLGSSTIDNRYNQCVVRFPDQFSDYKMNEVEWPTEGSAQHIQYLTQDNNLRLTHSVEINHATEIDQVLDFAEFTVRQSRSGDTISGTIDYVGFMLEPNDIVQVSSSPLNVGNGSISYWRLLSMTPRNEGTVDITLMRYDEEDYSYSAKDLKESFIGIEEKNPDDAFPIEVIEGCERLDFWFKTNGGMVWHSNFVTDPATSSTFMDGYDNAANATPNITTNSVGATLSWDGTSLVTGTFTGDCGFDQSISIVNNTQTPGLNGQALSGVVKENSVSGQNEVMIDRAMAVFDSNPLHIGLLTKVSGSGVKFTFKERIYHLAVRDADGLTYRTIGNVNISMETVVSGSDVSISGKAGFDGGNSTIPLTAIGTTDDIFAISAVISYFGLGLGSRQVTWEGSAVVAGGIDNTDSGGLDGLSGTMGVRLDLYVNNTHIGSSDWAGYRLGYPTATAEGYSSGNTGIYNWFTDGLNWYISPFATSVPTNWETIGFPSIMENGLDLYAVVIQSGDQSNFQNAYLAQLNNESILNY